MDDERSGYDAWEEMLNLSGNVESHTLEIINQENRETVLVNTLAYFLHPRLSHGLGNCIIQNLFGKIKMTSERSGEFLCLTTEFPCIESRSKEGIKRIDLFIEFEKLCIAIEAKIDSDVHNDLDAYSRHLARRAGDRDTKRYLLQRKSLKTEKKDWENITWSDLVENCTLEDSIDKRKDHLQSLFQGLKNVDKTRSELKLGELTPTIKILDEKAEALKTVLGREFQSFSCKSWKGNKKIGREIFEPRVVLEDKKSGLVIDVCVGFRGLQFVIFNRNKYQPELYDKMREKYSFVYWQDYSDTIELFDRYLLCDDGGKGPQVSNRWPNASEEKTIFFKDSYFGEKQNWIEESVKKIKELINNLN